MLGSKLPFYLYIFQNRTLDDWRVCLGELANLLSNPPSDLNNGLLLDTATAELHRSIAEFNLLMVRVAL